MPDPTRATSPAPRPLRVGDRITVRGVLCEVFKLHPFGTVDVAEVNGPRAWRLTGLTPATPLAGEG